MSRGRRMLYVELNRPVEMEVFAPTEDDAMLLEAAHFVTDYFMLSIPEYASEYDVWLIKTLNRPDAQWLEITAESAEEMALDSTCSECEIVERIDHYQRHGTPLIIDHIDDDDEDY